jgi:6,7-dimethyl-8-ribityllumazine synthase
VQPVTHQGRLNAEGFRFAVVSSRWNDLLTSRLVEGALDALERLGAAEESVEHFRVPGSFKGFDAAMAAVELVNLYKDVNGKPSRAAGKK